MYVPSRKLALIIEYEGTRYCGFQLQANVPTIQREIEQALKKVTGEKIRIIGAGRTDSGVHAKNQVVSFTVSTRLALDTLIKALNFYLPDDIAVRSGNIARMNFTARRNAISREYRYTILNNPTRSPLARNFAYYIQTPLSVTAMNSACSFIIGRHDFASFTSLLKESTVRIVSKAKVTRENDYVFFDIIANSFLPKQVRCIVGSLIRIGLGKLSISEFQNILAAKQPGLAAPVAPAHGLCLMKVYYPEYEFIRGNSK